jgi:hypothetical protein
VSYDHGSFKASAEVIRDHLLRHQGTIGAYLFGQALRAGSEPDCFSLWRFLYDVGFLNARISDSSETDGYRHLYPQEDPNLVSKSRWNELQRISWEIGPAFRDYLILIQAERRRNLGLPPSERRRCERGGRKRK